MKSKAIATLVKIMESLPENIQDQIVEHLQEYIQQLSIVVSVSPDEKLEIPEEITSQKVEAGFDWEELRRRRESLPPDPNPMTVEEICEIVREVRREQRAARES